MQDNISIGISTGDFFKLNVRLEVILDALKKASIRSVELKYDPKSFARLTAEILTSFDRVSLHAPKIPYQNDAATKEVFSAIEHVHQIRPLDTVVVHPDVIVDASVFTESTLPWAIENMDCEKKTGQRAKDVAHLFEINPRFGFVLDVNHIFTNDATMVLADEWYRTYGDRLMEIHVSGYRSPINKEIHVPLFETKQKMIIGAIQKPPVPLIIESAFEQLKDFTREQAYILDCLG